LESTERRDIFPRAVRPLGDRLELCLFAFAFKEDLRGSDVQLEQLGGVLGDRSGTGSDPVQENVVLPASRLHPLAPFVLGEEGGLFESVAGGRILGVDALRESLVVHLEVIAEQRQPEAPLPLERTVTGAAVAAQLAQQRNQMPLEVRRFLRSAPITLGDR